MANFENLPNEIIFTIFKMLKQSDLYNLRVVNKRFKSISDRSTYDLVVCEDYDYGSYWFLTYDLKSQSKYDTVNVHKFSSFRKVFKLELSLRRLYLNMSDDDFVFLEQFKQLEHLELSCKLSQDKILNLPNLKTLTIELNASSNELELRFESKKLEVLYIGGRYDRGQLVISNTDKVKYLKIKGRTILPAKQFRNLQHLSLDINSTYLDKNILNKFKTLNVLECDTLNNEKRNLMNKINYILKQSKVLRRTGLIIRVDGVEIKNEEQISKCAILGEFNFQLKYYDLLSGYLFDKKCLDENEYDTIFWHFKNQIPQSLFRKFFNISCIALEELVNEDDKVNYILNNLIGLKEIKIYDCVFSQSFYDKLVDCKYLSRLFIFNCYEVNPDELLDFNFVTKFKELSNFYSGLRFKDPYDVAIKAFKQSKFLLNFEFKDIDYVIHQIIKKSNTYKVNISKCKFNEETEEMEDIDLFSEFDLSEYDLSVFKNKIRVNNC